MRRSILSLGFVLSACVGDSVVNQPSPEAGPDATTTIDAGTDAATDAAKEAEAPCVDGGAPYVNGGSGVQCDPDAGLAFCQKGSASCCVNGAAYKCNARGNCGTQTEFACDNSSDCTSGMKCCLKAPTTSLACGNRILDAQGSYCAANCPQSDIKLCAGAISECFNGTCAALELVKSPGKILSGCL
ncbi:hypothetical protein BH09MYX1_BH09MYX1_61390 [soil metagenome]